jgi:hypothetical protein
MGQPLFMEPIQIAEKTPFIQASSSSENKITGKITVNLLFISASKLNRPH